MNKNSCLGLTGRDRLSGFEGEITSVAYFDTGCSHIGLIKPGLDKDGKPYDIIFFDAAEISIVEKDGEAIKLIELKLDEAPFILGMQVVDKRTGFQGHCVIINQYKNGDSRVSIQGKELFEGKPAKPFACDLSFVEPISSADKDKVKGTIEKKPGCSIQALRD